MPAARTKASLNSPLANVAFAHSLNSSVGVHESKVARSVGTSLCLAVFEAASASLSGSERYLWVKSMETFRMTYDQTSKLTRKLHRGGPCHNAVTTVTRRTVLYSIVHKSLDLLMKLANISLELHQHLMNSWS